MEAFFELRIYKIFPGKMKEWLDLMEGTIIPFQVSKGMVIHGSFVDDDDDETYIWIRRFSSLKSKEKLYKDVYESEEWLNEMVDKVGELIDRNRTVVRNLKSTELSGSCNNRFWNCRKRGDAVLCRWRPEHPHRV